MPSDRELETCFHELHARFHRAIRRLATDAELSWTTKLTALDRIVSAAFPILLDAAAVSAVLGRVREQESSTMHDTVEIKNGYIAMSRLDG